MRQGTAGPDARRRALRFLLPLLALTILVGASSAHAAVTHTLASSFSGNLIEPGPIAIDQSKGYVYVGDFGDSSVKKFDLAGNPVNFSALGTNVLDGCCVPSQDPDNNGSNGLNPTSFAVDNSQGHNAGNLYFANDGGEGQTQKGSMFKPSGEYVSPRPMKYNRDNIFEFVLTTCGVAVDPLGAVYMVRPRGGGVVDKIPQTTFVDKFIPGAFDLPPEWLPRSTLYMDRPNSCSVAIDSTGAVYSNDSVSGSSTALKKYKPTLFNLIVSDPSGPNCHCSGPSGKIVDPSSTTFTVDPSNDDVFVNQVEPAQQVARFDASGVLQETFSTGVEMPLGIAVHGASGRTYVSDALNGSVKIYAAAVTPDIRDVEAEAAQKAATITALIAPAGVPAISDCYVEYGKTLAYGQTVDCEQSTPLSAETPISSSLIGLDTEESYHYRVVAVNSNGANRGVDRTFTTHAVANVQTDDATDVTTSTATLNGSFAGNGEPTQVYFEWGTKISYGSVTAAPPGEAAGAPTGLTHVQAGISGLDVNVLYHYRLVATNAVGTSYGPDRTFYSAPPGLPGILNTSVDVETPTAASVTATIVPNLGDTFYRTQYGPTTSYGSQTVLSGPVEGDGEAETVTIDVSDLSPGTVYHVRVVALNFGGTAYGPDAILTTPDRPRIDSTYASQITSSSARLGSQLKPNTSSTSAYFEYGYDTTYGQRTSEISLVPGDALGPDQEVVADIANLTADSTYHFRSLARNAFGTVFGPDMTLRTQPAAGTVPETKCPRGRTRVGDQCRRKACSKGRVLRRGKCVRRKHRARAVAPGGAGRREG